jgi:hypothetical protein
MNYNEPKNECQYKNSSEIDKNIKKEMLHRPSGIYLPFPE